MTLMTRRQARLLELIEQTAQEEETTNQFALRDVLTDLIQVADEIGLDSDAAIAGAQAVVEEEFEIARLEAEAEAPVR